MTAAIEGCNQGLSSPWTVDRRTSSFLVGNTDDSKGKYRLYDSRTSVRHQFAFTWGTSSDNLDPVSYVADLKCSMQAVHATSPRQSARPHTHTSRRSLSASHIFVRHDAVRKPLQKPYDGHTKWLHGQTSILLWISMAVETPCPLTDSRQLILNNPPQGPLCQQSLSLLHRLHPNRKHHNHLQSPHTPHQPNLKVRTSRALACTSDWLCSAIVHDLLTGGE